VELGPLQAGGAQPVEKMSYDTPAPDGAAEVSAREKDQRFFNSAASPSPRRGEKRIRNKRFPSVPFSTGSATGR